MKDQIIKEVNFFLEKMDTSSGPKKSGHLGGYIALIERDDGTLVSAKAVGHRIKDVRKYHSCALKEARLLIGEKEMNSYRDSKAKNANAIVIEERILSISGNFSKEIAEAILIAATDKAGIYVFTENKKFNDLHVKTSIAHLSEKRNNPYIQFLMSI